MFIVLAIIQSNLFTVNRDAHGDELVDEGIAYPAHGKRIDKDDGNGEQMEKENHETVPCTCNQSFLDEDTREHRAEDTTCTMCREYVESIVNLQISVMTKAMKILCPTVT